MKNKFLALLILSTFMFAACGDDSSSTSADPSSEESSSSEKDAKSSSSKKGGKSSSSEKSSGKSSSSAKEDSKSSSSESPKSSSSIVLPEGTRAAKLTDLQKNYELKLFDQTVYLSTGSKQGVFALRIPDELWVVTYTDFAGGVVSFYIDNGLGTGLRYSTTDAAQKIVDKCKVGFKISFVVKEGDNADEDDIILYSVDGGDYSEAIKASVAVPKGKVSKAEAIQKKIYECADGDSTRTFKFFDSSYIYETSVDDKVVSWHAGHYDVQRSTLLMIPLYYAGEIRTLFTYSVDSSNTITAYNGESMDCTVEDVEYDYEDAKDFAGEWVATKDGIYWTFTLKADGTSKLEAFEGSKRVELKSGTWDVYGYYMMIHNNTFLHTGSTTSMYGQVQTGTRDPETGKISGFSFIHNDPDTPHIPTSFDAPEYDD
jgi:hypothetical protein